MALSRFNFMFGEQVLELDVKGEIQRIVTELARQTARLRRRGLVVAVSGGVDSSTCLALAARAVGPQRVQALLLPERDSSPESARLGQEVCESLGVPYLVEDLTELLAAAGCYRRRDEAIRTVFPEYDERFRQKIVVPPLDSGARLTYFSVVIASPDGETKKARLPLQAYLQVVAATNFKQRTRTMMEYYHADRLNYAVVGTPNRLEYDQGFFVKGGDGLADLKPICHLYKTQVYALARQLRLPEAVCNGKPTTDTYSLEQGQDEFFFGLPYRQMDLLLWAANHQVPAAEAGPVVGLSAEQVVQVYRDIKNKRRAAEYLHAPALSVEEVWRPA